MYLLNLAFFFYAHVSWFMYSIESDNITLPIALLYRKHFRATCTCISYTLLGCLCKKRFESWCGCWHGNSDRCSRNSNWWVLNTFPKSTICRIIWPETFTFLILFLTFDFIDSQSALINVRTFHHELGKYHGSIVTNDENMELWCVKAGQNSADLVHPMPYSPELHFREFNSAIADAKNSVAVRTRFS